jgi:hypothetical protein
MRIVPITHVPGGGRYIFETPVDLKKGDLVMCETKRGENIGICISDSFTVDGSALDFILQTHGTNVENMKSITGVYVYSKIEKETINNE